MGPDRGPVRGRAVACRPRGGLVVVVGAVAGGRGGRRECDASSAARLAPLGAAERARAGPGRRARVWAGVVVREGSAGRGGGAAGGVVPRAAGGEASAALAACGGVRAGGGGRPAEGTGGADLHRVQR